MAEPNKISIRRLLIRLAATLDRIGESDLSLEAQIWIKECSQLCDLMLSQLYALTEASPSGDAPASDVASANVVPPDRSPAPETGTESPNAKRILVIDDDEDMLRLMNYLLTKRGFSVECKSNPLLALSGLDQRVPDVILMDLMMPQMSGFELVRRIREKKKWETIKVLIGSSRTYDKDRLAVLQAGANDFIGKPYNFDELVLRLRTLMGTDLAAVRVAG